MRSALVVGSLGGIGRRVTSTLLQSLDSVSTVDIRQPSTRQVDLSDFEREGSFFTWLDDLESSSHPPDLIAWCAGVYDNTSLAEYLSDRINRVIDINLVSALHFLSTITRIQLRYPTPRRIVLLSSQAGVTGGTDAPYAASKAGITAATKSVAREYAKLGLRANVVSPGPTDTPMADVMGGRRSYYEKAIPIGRFNTANEVADTVCWLLTTSPDSLNGTVIDVDGGLVRR